MLNENVVIVGATSGIAQALSHVMSKRGCQLILAGRAHDKLEKNASDLSIRYQTKVFTELFEALDFESYAAFFDRCLQKFSGDLDGIVLCHGDMAPQAEVAVDQVKALRIIDVNFASAVSLLNLAANYFEQRQKGYIAAISSPAGDRGRQSNYLYGATKAGLSVYLQGLRNRLYPAGVHVLTVKPGFVDTPMTDGLLNPLSPLVATPQRVAADIDKAIGKRKDVLYTPWFWWGVMTIIGCIPESIFKRLKL